MATAQSPIPEKKVENGALDQPIDQNHQNDTEMADQQEEEKVEDEKAASVDAQRDANTPPPDNVTQTPVNPVPLLEP